MEEQLNQLLTDIGLIGGDDSDEEVNYGTVVMQQQQSRTVSPMIQYQQQQQQQPVQRPVFNPGPSYVVPSSQFKWAHPIYDVQQQQVYGPTTNTIDSVGSSYTSPPPPLINKQGPLRLPPARLHGLTTPTPDFVRIMKSLEFYPRDEEVRRALPRLSEEFARLRTALKEQSSRCDIDTYFAYLIVLKRLSRHFETADCVFDTFFSQGCNNTQSCHFVYEYMQALLMTAARLCDQSYKRGGGGSSGGESTNTCNDYMMAHYVYEELKRTVEYCQSDKPFRSGKWLYQQSLESLGSGAGQGLASMKQTQHQQQAARELTTLRNFIKYDLHGVDALEQRSLLCRIKMMEVGAALLQTRIDQTGQSDIGTDGSANTKPLTEQRCLRVYEKLAPLMLCCRQYYAKIAQQLGNTVQQQQQSIPNTALINYAQYHQYYWYVQQELCQARVEWPCFNDPLVLDFDTYGKRAVRRLCVLKDFLAQKEACILDLGLDDQLLREWDQVVKRQVLQLYDDVRAKAVSTVWQAGALGTGVTIPDVVAYQPPAPSEQQHQSGLLTIFTEKWSHLSQQPQYEPLVKVFEFFDQLASPQHDEVVVSNNNNNNNASIPTSGTSLTTPQLLENQRILGMTQERLEHLVWLVSQIKPTRGGDSVIFISADGCDYLRQQLELTQQFIAIHGLSSSINVRK